MSFPSRPGAFEASAAPPSAARERLEDELLVLRAQGGERAAFAELVARYQERLWRHAARVGGAEGAWDVLQETWLVLARGLRGLSDPARFRRWVYTVVTRLALRGRRAGAREHATASETLDAHAAPDDEAEARADESARVRRALDELAPEQRALLSLRYLEGFELAELAEVLGVPEGTVKSRLHSARAGLRARLERMDP